MSSAPLRAALLIPVLNEEQALPKVFDEIPRQLFARIVVADNGSTDRSAEIARARGAEVVCEPRRGYGRACLAGLAALPADIEAVVFMDGDASADPAEAEILLEPLARGEVDLVLGARVPERCEPGALFWQQRLGNELAVALIRVLFGFRYADLGPFRAIRVDALQRLEMRDQNYGWTAEMQVKAVKGGLRIREIPVTCRARIGRSKISGTLRGTVAGGAKILWTIGRLRFGG